jgi:hypothetical protein
VAAAAVAVAADGAAQLAPHPLVQRAAVLPLGGAPLLQQQLQELPTSMPAETALLSQVCVKRQPGLIF